MAPSRRNPPPPKSISAAASSGDEQVGQHTAKNLPPPEPAHQESDRSVDEDEEDDDAVESSDDLGDAGMTTKRQPLLPTGREDSDQDYEAEDSQSESNEVPLSPTPKPKGNVLAAKLAKSPLPKRKTMEAGTDNDHGQVGQNAEKLLEEKSALYGSLWQEVQALEAGQPGMWKGPFLNLADDKARALDSKLKKQRVAEINLQLRRQDIRKEVTKALIDIINLN